nr:hypothetical protein [Candidatus Woesearchaeota archaeon]
MKIRIESKEDYWKRATKEAREIDNGKRQSFESSLSFISLKQFRNFMTPGRLEILKVIKKRKPKSIYELAKMLDRDVDNVNREVKLLALYKLLILKNGNGKRKTVIPRVDFDEIRINIPILK